MLIVCNGAAKSGSTWLFNIVDHLLDCEWPNRAYLTKSTKHPTIRPDALAKFLRDEDFVGRSIITKTHYGNQAQRDLLLRHKDVRVLDMDRDLRDVIVSTYYDASRRDGFDGSFEEFYWLEGRSQADYLIRYHQLWSIPHPQVLITAFETLKTDFHTEVRRIANFLELTISDEALTELQTLTSIEELRESYKDDPSYADPKKPFFRKGIVGDWKGHFNARMLSDITRIQVHGISPYDRIELTNRFRRKMYQIWPSLSPFRSHLAKS
jgi:hypothetical protein